MYAPAPASYTALVRLAPAIQRALGQLDQAIDDLSKKDTCK